MGKPWEITGLVNPHEYLELFIEYLFGWWFGTSILFSHLLGISSSQLTNSFQRCSNHQPVLDVFHIYIVGWYIPPYLSLLSKMGTDVLAVRAPASNLAVPSTVENGDQKRFGCIS